MSTYTEIIEILESQGAEQKAWRQSQDARFEAMQSAVDETILKAGRPNLGGGEITVKHLQTADGRKLPFLRAEQKFADLYRSEKSQFNLGEFCRDNVVGSTKAVSSSALVPLGVGSQVIDAVRAQAVINAAGAGTIAIDGPSTLARISTSPQVYQHIEGATDIVESDVVVAPVTLNPKLLAVLVPLSVELVQDSPNLDQVLTTALAGAFAGKLDALCIAKLLADVAIAESAAGQDPAIWLKVLEAVGSALALNMAVPSAHISAPADCRLAASQLQFVPRSWLGKPPALASMLELQTTGLTAGTALLGNFAEAFAIAMRSALKIEVIRHAKPTSGSHLLVAHMRADGVVLQPGKLYRQLKTV